jgi:hypothetical protein
MSIYFNTGMAKTAAQINLPAIVSVTLWVNVQAWSAGLANRLFGSDTVFEITISSSTNKAKNELYTATGLTGTTVLSLNTWYHIAALANQNTGAGEIYVNGVLEGTGADHTQTPTTPDYLGIGGRDGAAANEVSNAILEDVRLYNGYLTAKQINDIFLSGIITGQASGTAPYLYAAWCRNTKGDGSALGADGVIDEHGDFCYATVPAGNAYYSPGRKKLRR